MELHFILYNDFTPPSPHNSYILIQKKMSYEYSKVAVARKEEPKQYKLSEHEYSEKKLSPKLRNFI